MSKSKSTSIIDADLSLSFTPELLKGITPEILKGLQGFLSFINGKINLETIYAIEEALITHEIAAAELAYVKSNPETAQIIEERYLAPKPNLEELLKLPEDSLGFAYASYMRAYNYEQDYYPIVEVQDDASYLLMRLRQTHDIWHTVTGFFNDDGGIKLGGFQLAQTHSPFSAMLSTGVILYRSKMNKDITPIVRFLQEGYDVGCQAKPFLAQKWEEAWEKPLADWRAELNVNVTSDSSLIFHVHM